MLPALHAPSATQAGDTSHWKQTLEVTSIKTSTTLINEAARSAQAHYTGAAEDHGKLMASIATFMNEIATILNALRASYTDPNGTVSQ